ncbi:UNVERIFIED_CONTAM: hypothetical protein HDU68_008255, partial [Siphonaria sp. JEL0065]
MQGSQSSALSSIRSNGPKGTTSNLSVASTMNTLSINNDAEILWNMLSHDWKKEECVTIDNLKAYSKKSDDKQIFQWNRETGRLIAISFSDDKNDGPTFDSKIPTDLGELSELRELALLNKGLFGPIPNSIGKLTNLVH